MKYVLHYALSVFVAGLAAVVQIAVVSGRPVGLLIDLPALVLVYWLVRRDVTAAALTAVTAGGLMDYFLGWHLPGQTFAWLVAVGLFFLLARRWLTAQTTTATWMNILLVWAVVGGLRWLLAGWAWVSYADQHGLGQAWPWLAVWRAGVAGVAAAIWQRFRRPALTRLSPLG